MARVTTPAIQHLLNKRPAPHAQGNGIAPGGPSPGLSAIACTHAASEKVLESNLRFLARRSPGACELIRAARPHASLELFTSGDGALAGAITAMGARRQLASRQAALDEGQRLAETADVGEKAAVVVRGFGMGHQVAALARRIRHNGAIFVYEPDTRLLRTVFERVDCSSWLGQCHIVVFTDAQSAAISTGVQGLEGMLAAGISMLDHPASRARLGAGAEEFSAAFTNVVKSVRTHIITTLVQVETTVRNAIQNLRWYASAPGVADLENVARGSPAVIVAAGPSLARNMAQLKEPGVRDRVVIIAVQTVLRTLLSNGIRPHFVTALDYHEISRRFYEGLSAADVEGITLVVEPKCSPAILAAWPGALRCVGGDVPDHFLGAGLLREMGTITPGATVAHLAYYLARHMGCDPAILMGQDLGFTDGQYYGPGAAIHGVWAGELSEFNTLEMMEWQRIMRMRSLLRKATDIRGRDIYVDEQMATYLMQFERDFAKDAQRGLTTIDATEGGVAKQHAPARTLREALLLGNAKPHAIPPTPPMFAPAQRAALVATRLADLRRQSEKIERISRNTARTLRDMQEHHADQARVNRLIGQVQANGREVAAMDAYWGVQFINQTGQLKRFRTDRAIDLDDNLEAMEKQKLQIERDIENVTWLADAAAYLSTLLEDGIATARGGEPITRDPSVGERDVRVTGERTKRVLACIAATGDPAALSRTLARLDRCRELDGVLVTGADSVPSRTNAKLTVTAAPANARLLSDWQRSVRAARLWSRHCWRGGIANLSIYDEVCCPRILSPLLESHGADAAAVLGADWTLVDPALVDSVIARYRERPAGHPITFTQAPPGLAACVAAAGILAESAKAGGPHATIGGLLGYIPIAPQADPIAKPVCPAIPAAVRDILARCIPDSPARTAALAPYEGLSAAEIAERMAADPRARCPALETLWLDARFAHGATAERIAAYAEGSGELAVTIDARRTAPHLAAAVVRSIASLRTRGVAGLHIRTRLLGGIEEAESLLESGAEVISVDLLADTAETYVRLTGVDARATVLEGVQHLLQKSPAGPCGLPPRWIVPRITRRDGVYGEIERFYDRWLLVAGACVIDALPEAIPGERISPLPLPANVRDRRILSHVDMGA